jgi:thioredoxin-like negative regulator of GroEL
MKHSLVIAFLLLAVSAIAELPAGWNTNFTATLSDARTNNRPALAFFTASWCGPCKMMVRTTLTNEAVTRALGAFSCVAVDIDEQASLARLHEIRSVPTFKVFTPEGDDVADTSGFQPPELFVSWLTNTVTDYAAMLARRAEAARKLAKADALLAKTDTASLNASIATLLDLCAMREGEAAKERLAALGQRRPDLLLAGLEHPKLAARIQAANLLRARLGEDFNADPWADDATRQKFAAQWREKLAGQKQ